MKMELTLVHELPAEFTFTTELGQDQWAQADANRRNDIISDAMDEMVMKLLEEKRIRLVCVEIDGVEYDEE